MAYKNKTFYECQSCGYVMPKWAGKCPGCDGWNTLTEVVGEKPPALKKIARSEPVSLQEITIKDEDRLNTGIDELNRVMGGGIVPGSLTLIGGDPGIGKSTLVLQLLQGVYKGNPGIAGSALYVSGEESLKQIKLRANRLNVDAGGIVVLSRTSLEAILDQTRKLSPLLVIIDSIQTVYTEDINSAPGSMSQVRESALKLMLYAKQSSVPVFVVGHVTKDGAIAGPKALEHIVDTVIYFEGDRGHPYRLLRAVKNRFGSTNEIGVFEMKEGGLEEVTNPSELFLSERPLNVAGTTVVSTVEGTRPLLVELQSLVTPSSFGVPRRTGIGVDINRVNLLIAVLDKGGGLHLGGMDIFLNVVGGLKVTEPAFDLGIVATMASSFKDRPVDPKTVVFGEIGLSGEIRAVSQAEARIREAAKIGFTEVVLPESNLSRLSTRPEIKLVGVKSVNEALKIILSR